MFRLALCIKFTTHKVNYCKNGYTFTGHGVFAKATIERGSFLVEYVGKQFLFHTR